MRSTWASLLSAKSGSTSSGKLRRKRQPVSFFEKNLLGRKLTEDRFNAEVHSLGCTAPFKHFQLLLRCPNWPFQERLSHTNLDMDRVTHMTVLHKGEPLKPLPECFEVKLVSTRRGKRAFCSTLFPLVYLLRGNVKANTMILEPWRKNDHDTILYEMNKMTMTRKERHYMSPTKEITAPLESNPLAEFMARWRGHYLDLATPRFWQPPGFSEPRSMSAPVMKTSRHRDLQTVPNYAAVPGWFVSPFEGCEEIATEIEILGHLFSRTFFSFSSTLI